MSIGNASGLSDLMTLRAAQLNRLALNQAMSRIGSGRRNPSAGETTDAAVTSISVDAKLAALNAETKHNQRGLKMAVVADAALGDISRLLHDARELVVGGSDPGRSAEAAADKQFRLDAIIEQVDQISTSTTFDGQPLLDGSGVIGAPGKALQLISATPESLGRTKLEGKDSSLVDLRSGGVLEIARSSQMPLDPAKVVESAAAGVAGMRRSIAAFSADVLAPRLTEIAAARAHLLATVSILNDTEAPVDPASRSAAETQPIAGNSPLSRASRPTGSVLDIRA